MQKISIVPLEKAAAEAKDKILAVQKDPEIVKEGELILANQTLSNRMV